MKEFHTVDFMQSCIATDVTNLFARQGKNMFHVHPPIDLIDTAYLSSPPPPPKIMLILVFYYVARFPFVHISLTGYILASECIHFPSCIVIIS